MTKNGNGKKNTKAAVPRKRRRRVRMEDHPDVQAWIVDFKLRVENEHGYTPTDDQATMAFLVEALRAMGRANREKGGQ